MGTFDIGEAMVVLPEDITELRPHQPVAISEAVRFLSERKVVFLDAPTGAGKTIIAEGVRQVMHSTGHGMHRAMYLCTTKSLQEQFLHDFRYAKLIKGRANYPTYDDLTVPQSLVGHRERVVTATEVLRREKQRKWVERATIESVPVVVNGAFLTRENPEHCVFCNQPLTHPVSRQLGYGPVCGRNKNLEHRYGYPLVWEKWLSEEIVEVPIWGEVEHVVKEPIWERASHKVPGERFEAVGSRHLDAGMCTKKQFDVEALPICDQCLDSPPDLHMPDQHEDHRVGHCHFCHPWQYCPYYQAKWAALGAELAVANTSYFLTEANGPGEFGANPTTGKPKFGFFVVDEADTLESVLMSHIELSLSKYAIRKLGLELPRLKTKPESWLEWAEKSMAHVAGLSSEAQKALALYIEEPPPQELSKDAESLQRYVGQFAKVVHALRVEPDNWVYDGYDQGGVKLKPVTISTHARSLLWRHGVKFLLMSATMVSPRQMAQDLGLDEHEWEQVVVDSNFPVDRRPVWVMSRANMTHKTKDEHWPKMVTGIEEVLDLHPSERVLVHTHSYPLTEYLNSALRGTRHGTRLLTYTEAKQRDGILESFKNKPDGVLLAPSLDRGIDLPDDLCRAIIIAKVPFPNLGDKQVNKRFYGTLNGKGWFLTETIRSLVQMTGRGMRHENDHCITYILDAQFASNIWTNPLARNRIPRWWTAALNWEPPRRL